MLHSPLPGLRLTFWAFPSPTYGARTTDPNRTLYFSAGAPPPVFAPPRLAAPKRDAGEPRQIGYDFFLLIRKNMVTITIEIARNTDEMAFISGVTTRFN